MHDETHPPAFVWPAALAFGAVVGTLATACMMPFVGLAVIAAATMPLKRAALTVAATWAANQLLGFALLGYPLDGYALGWGAALGLASLAAVLTAKPLVRGLSLTRLALAFVVAFAVYEGLLFAYAGIAGGRETFAPAIVLSLAANDATWGVILVLFRLALGRTAPKWFGTTRALRPA